MIPHVTIFMPLHSSDSLYFLLSFRHNVSAAVSPRSLPPLIPQLSFSSRPSSPSHCSFCFILHHTLPSFSPSHPSSSGGPCTRLPAFLHSFIVPGSETQLPPLFLHAWCIILTRVPFLQLSFITPVLSAFLANSPATVTLCFHCI